MRLRTGVVRFGDVTGDMTGAVADLGVLVPLVAALIVVNGIDAGAALLAAGLLAIGAGAAFRIPFPVQPLKALTAVAVATGAAAEMIHAAGFLIGAFLLLLSLRGVADVIARVFTPPVVRALQLGVGLLLVLTAVRLVAEPPALFAVTLAAPWPLVLFATAIVVVAVAAHYRRHGIAVGMLAAGVVGAAVAVPPDVGGPALQLPQVALPEPAFFGTALVLLVIPQLPLTFGNAVVAVTDVARGYFGEQARRVTPARVCVSAGVGNVGAALLGGMPLCHGSGGLTAHYRLGARTAAMNVMLGGALVVVGLLFAPHVLALLGLLPVWALAAFLAYAGARHALLVADLRGLGLAIAVASGVAGALLGNLFVTTIVALVAVHSLRLASRRPRGDPPQQPPRRPRPQSWPAGRRN